MKKILLATVVLALLTIVCTGCSSSASTTPEKKIPEWVNGKIPTSATAIYARGQSNLGPNPVLARKKAEDEARQELGRTIQVKTKSLMDQFAMSHQDFMNSAADVSSEFTRTVSRSVSEATLIGVQIEEVWTDSENKVVHALAIVNKSDLVDQIKAKAKAALKPSVIEQKTDEALKMLDKELEKWDVSK